jgi:PAS domain S-box-containing protein
LFVALAFAMMVIASYLFVSDIERRNLQRNVRDAVKYTEANINAIMLEPETILASVAETIRGMIFHGDSVEKVEEDIIFINNYVQSNEEKRLLGIMGFYGFFDVFGGEFIAREEDWIPPEDFVPQSRPWYIAAVEANGEVGITKPYTDIISGEISITFSRRIFDEDGIPLGIVCLDMKLDRVRQLAINTQFAENGYGFLLNENMEIIAHPEPSMMGLPLHAVKSRIASYEDELKQNGYIYEVITTDYRGIESIVFIDRFKNNWYMGIVTPKDIYFKSTRNMALVLTVLGIILAMALITVLLFLFSQVNNENEKSQVMAHWYNSILNAIPLPITVTDADTKWTYINTAVENFLGIKLKDAIGKPCSNWGANICNTPDCGIACARRGMKQTYFTEGDSSYQVDVAILKDTNDKTMGYIEVVEDITNMKLMAKKQADAEAANIAKTAFLAKVSHEVRTPMNAIIGITEIQLQDETLSPDMQEALGKIYNSGYLLLGIINDILDLSKIEAGKLELTPINYDVPSLINDTVHLNIMRFDSKPIVFDLQLDENIPLTLFGDELRIKQILNNLLSNAFKYTDSGKVSLSISVEKAPADMIMLVFRITDTGQGMTAEQIDKLFDEYTRFNTEANRAVEGAGLGMNITKQLIDLMNGEISVESEPGKGSLFTVRLPQRIVDGGVLGETMVTNLKQFRLGKMSQMKKAPQVVREYMPYGKVLIVDDVETNLYVAKGLMSPYGLSIDTAESGYETIEKIRNGAVYDIVFMDHFMPKMDGIEAAKIMRSMGYAQPIVALTANALTGQAQMYSANGFDGFVSKPIDIYQLNAVLNKMVRDRHHDDALEVKRRYKNNPNEYSVGRRQLGEIFTRDAEKTAAILETIYKKHDYTDDDLQLYIVNIHAIKSALANIGETKLADTARELEDAAREQNRTVLFESTPIFLSSLREVIEKIKPRDKNEGNDADFHDDDRAYLLEIFAAIQEACADNNRRTAKDALSRLQQKSWPRPVLELLETISEHLLHSEFTEIINLIKEYK